MAWCKVGDEVRYIGADGPCGRVGTVVAYRREAGYYEVEFPGWTHEHDGSNPTACYDRFLCFGASLELVARPLSPSRVDTPSTFEDALSSLSSLVVPTDAKERKNAPIVAGCLDYFPSALLEVAKLSKLGNDQHNPGQPMHWAREKSTDQADCIVRHLLDRGTVDTDGVLHSVKVAWRALALAQLELEELGAKKARGAK